MLKCIVAATFLTFSLVTLTFCVVLFEQGQQWDAVALATELLLLLVVVLLLLAASLRGAERQQEQNRIELMDIYG